MSFFCSLRGDKSKLIINVEVRDDTEVSCVFMESCILPCSFQSGADPVIIWIQLTAGLPLVHYYDNKDQLGLQDQHFRNRTSLFKDQISRGNASLQLTGVEVQDQGRYRCYTRTNGRKEESFINLRVDGNRIICSSEGIYPEPDLTWSTSPPSNLNLQNQTSIQQTEQQLYNISSSLILSDSETHLIYICTISTRSKITCRHFLIHFLLFVLMMMFFLSVLSV
uniref:Ig-like domain-containing protein n=1 Tax=Lates calcarifer TaxID=8187 RepID=A0A4W6D714_LATCA